MQTDQTLLVTNTQAILNDPWYALRVTVRHERAVDRRLAELGYESLLPVYRSRRVWSDRIKALKVPLFPGYVFCRLSPDRAVKTYMVPRALGVVRGDCLHRDAQQGTYARAALPQPAGAELRGLRRNLSLDQPPTAGYQNECRDCSHLSSSKNRLVRRRQGNSVGVPRVDCSTAVATADYR